MQIINVIGGSGFIGTRLVQRLTAQGKLTVRISDTVPSKSYPDLFSICDVRSADQLNASIDNKSIIINLAAEHRDDVQPLSLYEDVNVGGAQNICDVASVKGVQTIVFISTVAVYGFARIGIDESGEIAPFNDYGRTKHEAEEVFKTWHAKLPDERTLVIIRPTVVFGEQNRGNVYNLLRQIAKGKFVMVGNGENCKSMAYVENVAAFIEYSMSFKPGVHIYNFIDKPNFTMNSLVASVNRILGRPEKIVLRIPFFAGYTIGRIFDLVSVLTNKRFSISSIRVKKFCANSVYNSSIDQTGFVPPMQLEQALAQTIKYEFVELYKHESGRIQN